MTTWLRCIDGVDLTGKYRGRPVRVVGTARGAWEDLRAAPHPDSDIIAVKMSGLFLRNTTHWCGLHREAFAPLIPAQRYLMSKDGRIRADGVSTLPLKTISHSWKKPAPGVQCTWFGDLAPDFSGCFATMLALTLGYSPVILCGIPRDDSGHFYEPLDIPTASYPVTNDSWYAIARAHAHEVFSMSGWTRDLFDEYRAKVQA